MKRTLALIITLMLVLVQFGAFAEMGVQIIGGPETETEPVSLDDIKLNVAAEVDGYATFTATSFEYLDRIGYYRQGRTDVYYDTSDAYLSGNEADYAVLFMDILNTTTNTKDYLSQCEVKVVYDDKYEYAGWFYQQNYNNETSSGGPEGKTQNTRWVINSVDQFGIDPMYVGHYLFGCTLPNAVINSKAPLRMVISIDGNEITYNVRK